MAVQFRREAYAAVVEGAAVRATSREGVLVSGPGAFDWLQGQVSQDLSPLQSAPAGTSAETLLLSPQGKIDAVTRVTVLEAERFLLDVGSGAGETLRSRLARFKLRVKADLSDLEPLAVAEVRGPLAPSPAELSAWAGEGLLAVVEVSWPPLRGRDIIVRGELPLTGPPGCLRLAGEEAAEAFEAVRIEAGVPELGREVTDRSIPQEAGELVAHTVSFTKGCYTGQELVARVDARGSNTPRRLLGVVIEGQPPPALPPLPGETVAVDGQEAGALTSVAWSEGFGAYVALALVKRGVGVTETAEVAASDGGRRAALRALPLVRAGSGEKSLQQQEIG